MRDQITLCFDAFKKRIEDIIEEIEAMSLDDPIKGAGSVAVSLEDLYKVAKRKYQSILLEKDCAIESKKKERQKALDELIPDIVNCVVKMECIDDELAGNVANQFFNEYVLDNLGRVRGKFAKYQPSVLAQVKVSFAVYLSTEKALSSIVKYISREEVILRDYPALIRQVLASLFHDSLRPFSI